jgi:hypothetical protein
MTPRGYCACGCGKRATQLHHAVYQQHLQRGDPRDPRNLVPLYHRCHMAHHGIEPLPLSVLPSSVFEFARETLGAGAAFNYLTRRYAGSDWRLDELLTEWEAAR